MHILTRCKLSGQTGVEMEALTAASVAALTLYDMCKAVDKGMEIGGVRLLEKRVVAADIGWPATRNNGSAQCPGPW